MHTLAMTECGMCEQIQNQYAVSHIDCIYRI